MQSNAKPSRGMVVAPHHLAAKAGRDILREGGNAIEAMVAAASTIATVYPHMNSIGGDGFWLISEPGKTPVAIEACGAAAQLADRDYYAGHVGIPARGPLAALTTAGTVGGGRWPSRIRAAGGHVAAVTAVRGGDRPCASGSSRDTGAGGADGGQAR
ncbi:gamma-glutamyltransferase [Salinicola acroporae]|uniref:gamma-glutamyltransferase n=1 Tax=Salinicola acroporae TaxID=1541440 RepID=UPI002457DC01|nr:gamma-glutamyltransferase [Salinicola acroporae]